jgi:glutamate decarboxylase
LATPSEIEAAFSSHGCALPLDDGAGASEATIMEACRLALRYSVKSNHPLFFNQLYGRVEPTGLLAHWLTSAVNGNVHTYEVAPIFTLTEVHCLRKLAAVVGYPAEAEGLFVPGGSISNLYAIHLARFWKYPEAKTEGMWGCPRFVAFCSTHAHYSTAKAAHVLGLGSNNLVQVATNRAGQMRLDALEEAISAAVAAGKTPLYVCATGGTTVTGAFDDLRGLRRICDRHKMWLHVDACWGGASLLSSRPEVRALLDGIELTDSFAWNPHKFMGVPLQCSVFMTRHNGLLIECNSAKAKYLFQPDKANGHLDIGDKTIQCGRLPDSFKLWLAWRHVGDGGWAQRMDRGIALVEHMAAQMRKGNWRGRFKIVLPQCFTNLCFWYFPPGLRDFDAFASKPDEDEWQQLHKVAPCIKARMQQDGKAMIGFQSIALEGTATVPNFFRLVIAATWSLTSGDLEKTLADIDSIGAELQR